MEKLLKEAQAERTRLMESRVRAGEKSRDEDSPQVGVLGQPFLISWPWQASWEESSRGSWFPSP